MSIVKHCYHISEALVTKVADLRALPVIYYADEVMGNFPSTEVKLRVGQFSYRAVQIGIMGYFSPIDIELRLYFSPVSLD